MAIGPGYSIGISGIGGGLDLGFGSPWSTPPPPKEPSCDDALGMSEDIADALCPRWRQDGIFATSVPTVYDHQVKRHEKVKATVQNFTWWTVDRDMVDGLVKNIYVSWGAAAVEHCKRAGVPIGYAHEQLAVWVRVRLNPSKVSVAGPMHRKGTTEYRLAEDVARAVSDIFGLAVNLRLQFYYKKGD